MNKLMKEFREFAVKGNVVDMAVGIVIGAGFGKIVSSLVADIIMPPIGVIVGGVNFTSLKLELKAAEGAATAVTLNYGQFLQTVFDFTIIAFAMFLVIKLTNKVRNLPPPAPVITPEETLLAEIRDILKANRR